MSDVVTEPPGWNANHAPADAAQGTCTVAASALGRHVCRHITITLGGVGANAAGVTFVARDGATGAGTIIWTAKLSNLANTSVSISAPVNLVGSKNTAMTLESTGAPAASSHVTVAMDGYTDYGPV